MSAIKVTWKSLGGAACRIKSYATSKPTSFGQQLMWLWFIPWLIIAIAALTVTGLIDIARHILPFKDKKSV